MATEVDKGLAGIIVGETRLSHVDGEAGKLYYSGYAIDVLADNATFEEVVFLLWNNRLPKQAELDELTKQLAAEAPVPPQILEAMQLFRKEAHPMGILRTAVSMLGDFDPEQEDNSPEANQRKALRLTAKTVTLTAAWYRVRDGNDPVAPRSDLSVAANFVYMLFGTEPNPDAVRAIDTYLILLSEHSFNASTYAARVVTSTDADIYSAIVGAIGTLKGAKHGGANEAAMKIFLEIGDVSNVDSFFQNEIKGKGRRIAGIGHRVYKYLDPRAKALKSRAEALASSSGNSKWYEIAEKLESLAMADDYFKERRLYPNVDYYSAIVLYTLDLDVDFFTPLFAMSRMPGWTAHIIEQWKDNQLIRPGARYTGEFDLPWIPLEQR
jgi:citrate synthase